MMLLYDYAQRARLAEGRSNLGKDFGLMSPGFGKPML